MNVHPKQAVRRREQIARLRKAGLSYAVAFDKGVDFIGREALLRQRKQGVKKRLAIFLIENPEPVIWGGEPIYRNGKLVGQITSGDFGHTIGHSIGLGYIESSESVNPDYIRTGSYEIEMFGLRYPASVQLRPPYDPRGDRMRC